jgi:branched-chain amino acid transport system ATP-binding protein
VPLSTTIKLSRATAPLASQVWSVHVRLRQDRGAARHDLRVERGEIVALIGANGAGKSTTLRAISGLLKPAAGRSASRAERSRQLPADRIVALGIAHCPEERHVWPSMTVHENLALGATCASRKPVVDSASARSTTAFRG